MKRASLAVLSLALLAACQVTVAPVGTPKPGASARPGQATPKPGASGLIAAGAGNDPLAAGPRVVPGPIDEVEVPATAHVGEVVRLVAHVILSNGCISFVDAKAEADDAARRVTVSARVDTGAPDLACSMALATKKAEVTFTPGAAGAWTIVATRPGRDPLTYALEVLAAGASPAPSPSPSASATPGQDGWTSQPLPFTSLTAPGGAKAGAATAIGYAAVIGSSSCAAFEAADAQVDAAAKVVTLRGTRRVAPPGSTCTDDLRSHEGEVAVTIPAAGTWTAKAEGAPDVTFEVAP